MQALKQWVATLAVAALVVSPVVLLGQGAATSSITGTVVDKDGGVIPGATVEVTNADGTTFRTVTNGVGIYSIPALMPGTYKMSVKLQGFKTAIVDNIRVITGNPASVKVTLEIGNLTETVTVTGSTELINTQTATVSATLNSDQLNRMPTQTRNALNAVTFLPGVNTSGVNRDARVDGLPSSMINITLDGVSNNDNFLRSSDGFFASVTPRQDAVEAVTVTSAVAGANLGGSGAVTINFVTRSGSNQLSGSVYDYWRDPHFNTNYWFNERNSLPKNQVKLYQFGGRTGGPVYIPSLFDGRGKVFFFTNYEQVRFPNQFTRTRTVNNPNTVNGLFNYNAGTTTAPDNRTVDVMALAAANGQISTFDPIVLAELQRINASTLTTGTISATADPQSYSYVWLSPGKLFEHQPTVRIDANLSTKHRFSGSFAEIFATRDPDYLNSADVRFPGAPNYRVFRSSRPLYSFSLRSTLNTNMVNEARVGLTATHGASKFGQPSDPSQGISSFADLGGYALVIPIGTDWWTVNAPSWRAAPTISVDDSLTWVRGRHSFNLGGGFLRSRAWENAQQIVPGVTLGFNTANDPANFMFTTANFPGASTAQLNSARAVYAMLTGRVSAVTGQVALDPATNQYVPFGPRRREGRIDIWSGYAEDNWRLTPTLTADIGVRYDLQRPFSSLNDTMSTATLASACGISGLGDGSTYDKCNFFNRNQSGVTPQFIQLSKGTLGYNTDKNNFAPSIGIAWRPNVRTGIGRAILGDPELATIRAGYSVSYERQGISVFTGQYGSNPGTTISLSRSANTGDLIPAGHAWPLLFSETTNLYPAAYPATPTFPMSLRAGRADSINIFAPDIVIASARSWTVSFQRSISKDMAIDIRYVGNHGVNQWSSLNYNARDIESNGFLGEFKQAVANLTANNASGVTARKGSFAYFGAGSGTTPLPIYFAYLNGAGDYTNSALYTGADWNNTALTQDMIFVNPSPSNSSADLDGDSTRRGRAIAAGLPTNFFVLNPDASSVNVYDSGASTRYNSLQLDMRRRLSKGLSASINYVYQRESGSTFLGFKYGRAIDPNANVRHAIKSQWDWDIPVGRGKRFGTNMSGFAEGALGGWSFRGVSRIQAVMVDFGNVRLVNMTKSELQSMYHVDIRVDPSSGLKTPYMLPDDVIQNTRRAFSLDTTTLDGYSTALGAPSATAKYIAPANSATCLQVKAGDCAPRTLLIRAPFFTRFDVGLSKKFRLGRSTTFETAVEVLNLFDNVNFNFVANPGSGATIFQVTSAYTDASNSYDPGGRLGQLMFRFSW